MTTSVCGIDLGSRIARAEEAGQCAAAVAGERCHLRKLGGKRVHHGLPASEGGFDVFLV